MGARAAGRRYRKPEEWREVIKRQRESGLTVKDFCTREHIHEKGFYRSRRKLSEVPTARQTFVELAHSNSVAGTAVRVELTLPNGAVLRIA